MDKQSQPDILKQIDRRDGMTTPEGWHDDFVARMVASLPERPELENPGKIIAPPRTLWQRVRPYVYMAAMFAGVWCMLKMFSLMAGSASTSLESNPILAEAFSNETFVNEYIIDDMSQWDLMDDLMDDGIDPSMICDSIVPFE